VPDTRDPLTENLAAIVSDLRQPAGGAPAVAADVEALSNRSALGNAGPAAARGQVTAN
jgi:hypothetical protein